MSRQSCIARPGKGTGENDGVMEYWVKAYRNLTTAMIADLRANSARWRQERRLGPVIGGYAGSNTHHNPHAARMPKHRDEDFETMGAPYMYGSSVAGDRDRRPIDRMPIDGRTPIAPMPIVPQYLDDQSYDAEFGELTDLRSGHLLQEQAIYGRAQNPIFARSNTNPTPLGDSAPPGLVPREGNYYVPLSLPEQPARSTESARDRGDALDPPNESREP